MTLCTPQVIDQSSAVPTSLSEAWRQTPTVQGKHRLAGAAHNESVYNCKYLPIITGVDVALVGLSSVQIVLLATEMDKQADICVECLCALGPSHLMGNLCSTADPVLLWRAHVFATPPANCSCAIVNTCMHSTGHCCITR